MPYGQQHGPRNGRNEGRALRRDQSHEPSHDARSQQHGGPLSAGGRSEGHAQQRDREQQRAGYERSDWDRQGESYRTVRSEPDWDPQRYERDAQQGYRANGHHDSWTEQSGAMRPNRASLQSGPHVRQEHERGYAAEDSGRDEERRARYGYDDGFELEQRRLRGGRFEVPSRSFGAGYHEGQRARGEFDSELAHQERGLGQQLKDAGRRLVGKVERLVRNPKNYARSDERIREDVCDRLSVSPDVDPSELEVAVSGGEVTLTGFVSDRQSKFAAEEIASDVPGVHEVHNQLRTRRTSAGTSASSGSAGKDESSSPSSKSFGRS